MIIRPVIEGLNWYMCLNSAEENPNVHYWTLPLKQIVYNITIFVLFYILFKIKKIQIMLNLDNLDPWKVTLRLIKFCKVSRIFLIVTILEFIFLFVAAFLMCQPDLDDDKSKRESFKPLAIAFGVNNIIIFIYLCYLII